MATFNPGDRVYLIDGRECELVSAVDDRFAVRMVYDDDGEENLGDVVLVRAVYATAPREKLDAEVARLKTELAGIVERLGAARAEEAEIKKGAAERAALLAQHRATARIADFIAGKITHFVVMEYGGPVVMDVASAINIPEEDGFGRPRTWRGQTKLLTLYGAAGRDSYHHQLRDGRGLAWNLSRYSDGSGGSTEVIPCMSEEEARGIAAERIAALFADASDNGRRAWSGAVKAAEKLGLEVPVAVREHLHAEALKAAREWAAKAEASAAEARAELAALTREVTNQPTGE